MDRSSSRKLITRPVQNTLKEQKYSSHKSYSINHSMGVSQSEYRQKQQKNMFYSELRIQTNDRDVPLVRILKVNQQLQKKFVYYSTSIQRLAAALRTRALSHGFHTLTSNLIRTQRYELNVQRVALLLSKLTRKIYQLGMIRVSVQKNKQKVKQKAMMLVRRLLMAKIHSSCRFFLRNCQQKRLMSIVLEKAQEDEMVKMKLNLQIHRQITFSKQFILKCRPLTRYNPNNNSFENQVVKQNLSECLQAQLQRYQKIRQNVSNSNTNFEDNTKTGNTRRPLKQTSSPYQNQIVLMAIKNFNLSLGDSRLSYQKKIQQLFDQISQLQTEERYVQLQIRMKQSDSAANAYQALINQFYGKADEQIKKATEQLQDKNNQPMKNRLLSVLNNQKSRYLRLYDKIQSSTNKKTADSYLSKLYQSRCFNLQLCARLVEVEAQKQKKRQEDLQKYEDLYTFFIQNLNQIIMAHSNQDQLAQQRDRMKLSVFSEELKTNSSTIIINLSQCILAVHSKYKLQRQQTQKEYINRAQSDQSQFTQTQPQPQKQARKGPFEIQRQYCLQRTPEQQQQGNQRAPNGQIAQVPYSAEFQLLRSSIVQYIKVVNSSYQDSENIQVDNFWKGSLSAQKMIQIQQNVQINRFAASVNTQLVELVQNLKQSVNSANEMENQKEQIIEMIHLFYRLILGSSITQQHRKSIQVNQKWVQVCQSENSSGQKLGLMNNLNQIVMLFRKMSQKSKSVQDFSEQLRNILQQKLQSQRVCHQIKIKFLVRDQEYRIIQKQNRQFQNKQMDIQKQLGKLKSDARSHQQKQERLSTNIHCLKQQLQVCMNTTKTYSQQNDQLNRELDKLRAYSSSLNGQVHRLKLRQKQMQQESAAEATHPTKQFTTMESTFRTRISYVQSSNLTLQSQKCQLNQTVLQLKGKIMNLQRQIQEGKYQAGRKLKQIQDRKQQNSKLLQIQAAYKNQIQKQRSQKSVLQQSVSFQKGQLERHKKDQFQTEKQWLQRVNNVQVENKELKRQNQGLSYEVSQLSGKMRDLGGQARSRQKTSKQTQRQYLNKLSKLRQELEGQVTRQKQSHLSQLKQIQARCNKQQSLYATRIKQLEQGLQRVAVNQRNSKEQTGDNISVFNVVQFDQQQHIQSLKAYVETLQRQNLNISNKYGQLKRQLYSDETSTTFTTRTNSNRHSASDRHSVSFYQSLLRDLKVQNDGLYEQVLLIKTRKQARSTQEGQTEENQDQFWLKQLKRKQDCLEQRQRTICGLRQQLLQNQESILNLQLSSKQPSKVQNQTIFKLQHQISREGAYYQKLQQQLNTQIQSLFHSLSLSHQQCAEYKSRLNYLDREPQEPSGNIKFNYSQLLVSTKQVKQLFTNFIQATNAILYKLDRTSEIYLQFEQNRSQGQRHSHYLKFDQSRGQGQRHSSQSSQAFGSIVSLIEQFKAVIENNHETLKCIYSNLVCHPYTKTALQLQYLKQLTFNVIIRFIQEDRVSLVRGFLSQEIQEVFRCNQVQNMMPVQEIFVKVQEFMVGELGKGLAGYKEQLHMKAIQLDYLREKLNLSVDGHLISEYSLLNRFPRHSPWAVHPANTHHNYQYNRNDYKFIQHQQKRACSNNQASKSTSNLQYRPLTSLVNKRHYFDQKIEGLSQNEHVVFSPTLHLNQNDPSLTAQTLN